MQFQLFVERVFGVPVDAHIVSKGPKKLRIECYYNGCTWRQNIPRNYPVWLPENKGQPNCDIEVQTLLS